MAIICCRRRRGWPCVSARQADVGGASRHGCNVVPQKMWMGQAERMKRRTYVKMSTWMQPVVWMRLGWVGLRLPGVSELVGELSQGSLRLPDVSELVGEFSQGSLRLPDVAELARGVQPGQSQVAGCFRACPGSSARGRSGTCFVAQSTLPPHAFGPCCRCRGWRGHVGFSAFLSALSSRNRRCGCVSDAAVASDETFQSFFGKFSRGSVKW